jgi:Fe-S cluster biogenesis protein NfuA
MVDPVVEQVLENFAVMVGRDGGTIENLGVDEGVLKVRYTPGSKEGCPDCVLSLEDLCLMIRTSLETHAPHIRDVQVV